MTGQHHLDCGRYINAEICEIIESDRVSSRPIDARVTHHPFAAAEMNDNAFTDTWTEE